MKRALRQPVRGDALALVLIVMLFVVPIGALATGAGLLQAGERDRVPQPEAVFAAIKRSEFVDPTEVKVSMTWEAGAAIPAPDWGGLVAEVMVGVGDTVTAGTRVLRIDGIWRVAAPTPTPFYAAISADSSEQEIRDLNALLRSLNYDTPGDRWTWNTLVGVRSFAATLGVPGAAELEAFDPSWVLWIPSAKVVVGSVAVVPGQAAPAMGENVIVGPPRLRTISAAPSEGNSLPTLKEGDEWMLRVGDISVPYVADLAADAKTMAALAGELSATQPAEIDGIVQRAVAVDGWQVPISALHTDAEGNVCVFRGTKTKLEPVVVTVDRGAIGTARVAGALSARDRILVNVSEVARSRSCD